MEESQDDFKADLINLRNYPGEHNWCIRLSSKELFGPFDDCEPVIEILSKRPGGWGYYFDLVWYDGLMFWTAAFSFIYPDVPIPMQARPLFDPTTPLIRNGEIINRHEVLNS